MIFTTTQSPSSPSSESSSKASAQAGLVLYKNKHLTNLPNGKNTKSSFQTKDYYLICVPN